VGTRFFEECIEDTSETQLNEPFCLLLHAVAIIHNTFHLQPDQDDSFSQHTPSFPYPTIEGNCHFLNLEKCQGEHSRILVFVADIFDDHSIQYEDIYYIFQCFVHCDGYVQYRLFSFKSAVRKGIYQQFASSDERVCFYNKQ